MMLNIILVHLIQAQEYCSISLKTVNNVGCLNYVLCRPVIACVLLVA